MEFNEDRTGRVDILGTFQLEVSRGSYQQVEQGMYWQEELKDMRLLEGILKEAIYV